MRNYPHLQYINISKNQIVDLTPIESLENLLALNASENALEAVPQFKNKFLQVVDLSGNQLTSLSGSEGSSIVSIDFSGAFLTVYVHLASHLYVVRKQNR